MLRLFSLLACRGFNSLLEQKLLTNEPWFHGQRYLIQADIIPAPPKSGVATPLQAFVVYRSHTGLQGGAIQDPITERQNKAGRLALRNPYTDENTACPADGTALAARRKHCYHLALWT